MLGAVTAVLVLLPAVAAIGHAFQVDHQPAHGARLRAVPDTVALQLSEPVVVERTEIRVRRGSAGPAVHGGLRTASQGRVVQTPLRTSEEGIYVVSWHVVSAVDGHESAGEFAFAVGDVVGDLPGTQQAAEPLSPWAVGGSWLLFAGLALATGGLVSDRFLPLYPSQRSFLVLPIRLGLLGATAGAVTHVVGDSLTNTAAVTLTNTAAVTASLTSRPVVVASSTAFVLALALALSPFKRARLAVVCLVAVVPGLWAARSHAAAVGGVAAGVVDAVHVAAGALWVGSLAVVAMLLWRARHAPAPPRLHLVRSYARMALWLVGVVAVTGVVSAVHLLDGLGDLRTSGYGMVLVVKVAVVAAAVGVAAVAHTRGLRRGHVGVLRRATTAEAGLLAAVLVATALLAGLGPPAAQATADTLLGPPALQGPVVRAAGLAGSLTVGVVAGDDELQVEVFSPSGALEGTEVQVGVQLPDGRQVDLDPRGCGDGCVTQRLALPDGVTTVAVEATAPDWRGGRFVGELSWPPAPEQPSLLREVVARMRAVEQLELVEEVSSGPGAQGAPTRASLSGEAFVDTMPYGAGEAVGVRRVRGASDTIEFAMPASRMWFTLHLDEHGRVSRQRLVTPGHEIHHRIYYN